MRYRLISFFMIFFFNLSWVKAQIVPQFILEDIKHEILEVDSVNIKSDIDQMLGKYFSTEVLTSQKAPTQLVEIKPVKVSNQPSHSIHQLEDYIKNRIGSGTFDEVKKGQTDILIFGGDQNLLGEYLKNQTKLDLRNLKQIPSLYEQWGLSKFYLPSDTVDRKALLIWVVPPSIRYVRHYSSMFSALPKARVKSFVDFVSLKKIEIQAKLNAEKINKNNKIDYIAFGYNRLWKKALIDDPNLVLLKEINYHDNKLQSGLNVLSVLNKEFNQIINIGLFASDKTVWGELAALQLKAFLNPQLKGLIFMGSAGSLMNEINPYDLSVPKAFYRPGHLVKIDNFINQQKQMSNSDQTIHFDRHHGNTFSPLEQSKKYVGTLENLNIQTLDVEQSLVAEAVSDYNRQNKTEIKFGAINLITDKPYSILTKEPVKNGLDHLNSELKEKARLNAVKLSLASILINEKKSLVMKCEGLFL